MVDTQNVKESFHLLFIRQCSLASRTTSKSTHFKILSTSRIKKLEGKGDLFSGTFWYTKSLERPQIYSSSNFLQSKLSLSESEWDHPNIQRAAFSLLLRTTCCYSMILKSNIPYQGIVINSLLPHIVNYLKILWLWNFPHEITMHDHYFSSKQKTSNSKFSQGYTGLGPKPRLHLKFLALDCVFSPSQGTKSKTNATPDQYHTKYKKNAPPVLDSLFIKL